jgi:recombination protein RecA
LGKKRNRSRGRRRQKRLDAAVATIQGRYGPWALIKGRRARTAKAVDGNDPAAVPHIPTGFPQLDQALGIGGLPRGRMCEIVGPATSGKTTLALKFLAQAQKRNGTAVGLIDQALYFDPDYAHRCGLDLSHLWVGTPRDLQEALVMVEALVRSGGLAALVLDTLEFLWTDRQASSLLEATLNRLSAFLARSGMILLVLHETRIDSPSGGSRSLARSSSPALSALAHYSTVRLHVTREGWVKRHGDVRGYKARVEVLKNKLGPAGRTAHIQIDFNGTVRGNGL